MKVLVTGACGQIGSHTAESLLERGDEVLSIDNLATGRTEHLKARDGLVLVEGSIADPSLVRRCFESFRPDVIVHAAASYKDPSDWYTDALTNCVGGANLVRAAIDHGVGRFIYFQTALCYGTAPLEQPITLAHPKRPANSSYAITKTAAEDFLEISGLDYVSFRLANVVGPRNVSGPLPTFFERLSQGKRCFVTEARRDFVYVKDLVSTVLQAIDGTGSGAYHFSTGTDVAIRDLYDEVARAMRVAAPAPPEVRPLGADEAASILLDPSRTFDVFGSMEFTPLSEVVRSAVAYYAEVGVKGSYTHLAVEQPS